MRVSSVVNLQLILPPLKKLRDRNRAIALLLAA